MGYNHWNNNNNHCGNNHAQMQPMQHCPQKPVVLPAVVHPPKCNVTHSMQEYVVPEVHPSHTTHVHNDVYKHVHSYPHSQDQVAGAQSEHYHCPPEQQHGHGKHCNRPW
ncbi:CotD family spore coat protein [Salicibibacter cibarius]|nr:CotD family spore coat protein [Salicibibacter cibarius]